jgi:predicted DNA-binding ribbon-helix-helix protein
MYLSRIKNPEQLKHLSPGEFGKLLGTDRVPEAKCLRKKIKEICSQSKTEQWNMSLAGYWSTEEANEFYYIDGHVQIYSGYKAKLGKKHIARQKLCLPGIQEFWVNNHEGLPYFYVTGQVNEKLLEMLTTQIIPSLLKKMHQKYSQEQLDKDPHLARFTIVFDREGYSPSYFRKLWENYRITVLTYRKNVKDKWAEEDFQTHSVQMHGIVTKMRLAEKQIELNGLIMREVRRLTKDGHQTSIITTNQKLSIEMISFYMFSRWTQENFFKYLRQEYDFDRIAQYLVEQIDNNFYVVNPEYNILSYKLKKVREKISRRRAQLYKLYEENIDDNLDNTAQNIKKQSGVNEELIKFLEQQNELVEQRKTIAYKIKIEDMPEHLRYTKLTIESKRFLNIIKMICYRAETSCANLLADHYRKHNNEKRALVKSIINTNGDLVADYENKTLIIKLYTQSNPRMNYAITKLCNLLNKTETLFPETELKMKYELATG